MDMHRTIRVGCEMGTLIYPRIRLHVPKQSPFLLSTLD